MFHQIKPILFAIIAVGLMAGCKKEDPEPAFVPGNIIVGFEKEVTLRQALEFATVNADSIATIRGFFYYSNLPNDSLEFIRKIFVDEGIEYASAQISSTENRIVIIKNYLNSDDKSTIVKWLAITEDPIFQFEDMQTFRSMMFYIRPGTEKQWIDKHVNDPYVRYAELNYYISLKNTSCIKKQQSISYLQLSLLSL